MLYVPQHQSMMVIQLFIPRIIRFIFPIVHRKFEKECGLCQNYYWTALSHTDAKFISTLTVQKQSPPHNSYFDEKITYVDINHNKEASLIHESSIDQHNEKDDTESQSLQHADFLLRW